MKIDWLFICLLFGVFTSSSNSVIPSAFYSIEVEGMMTESTIGLIFAIYAFGVLLVSIFLGKKMNKKGRKKLLMTLGLLL